MHQNTTLNEALDADFPEVLSYYKFSLCKYEMNALVV